MKKYLLLLTCVTGLCPVFAQIGDKAVPVTQAGLKAAAGGAELVGELTRQVARQTAATSRVFPLQFVDYNSATKLRASIILSPARAQALRGTSKAPVILAERVPLGRVYMDMPAVEDLDMYHMLKGVADGSLSFWRGMGVPGLEDLKDILIYGLKVGKTENKERIYMSNFPSTALQYAARNKGFQIMVRMPSSHVQFFIEREDGLVGCCEKYWSTDIPAFMISDVLVWLKIEKDPAWYKVVWKNQKLVFSRAQIWPEDEEERELLQSATEEEEIDFFQKVREEEWKK